MAGGDMEYEDILMRNQQYALEIERLREEQEDTIKLIETTGAILAATADALHGGPLPDEGMHSWHDLPELAEKLRAERDEVRREICERVSKTIWNPQFPLTSKEEYALARGWDCYKEKQ
jgi:hypothetical protein